MTTTVRTVERELAETWREADRRGTPPEQCWRALYELADLDPDDVEAHARTLAQLGGSDFATAWIAGIQVGIAAALKTEVSRITNQPHPPAPQWRRRTTIGALTDITLFSLLVAIIAGMWGAIIALARWLL